MSSEPILDLEAIENLRALNPDDDSFVKEIVALYLEDTPARIEDLKKAFAEGDTPTFIRAAHTIKGSSSNLGAAQLRSLAEILEHGAKRTGLEGLDAHIPTLEALFAETKAQLTPLL